MNFSGEISTKAIRYFETTNFLLIGLGLVFGAFKQPFDVGDVTDEDDGRDDGRDDCELKPKARGAPEAKAPGEDLGIEGDDHIYNGDYPCDEHAYG